MVLIVSMIVSVVAGVGVEIWRYRSEKKENEKLPRGKIISDALEQALIIFLSAVFALWITNLSETGKIKNQTKAILSASEDELESVIYAVSGGAAFGDQTFIGQLYTLVNYERVLDLRDIMFNESIFIHLDPVLAANISRFEANHERFFQELIPLLEEPDETTDGVYNLDRIYYCTSDLISNARALIGMINQEIAYIDGKPNKTDSLYEPQMIPTDIEEKCDLIFQYLQTVRKDSTNATVF